MCYMVNMVNIPLNICQYPFNIFQHHIIWGKILPDVS